MACGLGGLLCPGPEQDLLRSVSREMEHVSHESDVELGVVLRWVTEDVSMLVCIHVCVCTYRKWPRAGSPLTWV